MKTILKNIRVFLKMSQAEFANKMSVSFATINRWENGHAIPTNMAQTNLIELCRKNSVPVYEMILSKIQETVSQINPNDRRILYHGSKSGIKGRIAPRSRRQCDFGRGFYMGTDPSQALTLICDFDEAKFYVMSVDTSELNTIVVPADIEWAMLVAFNRGKMDHIKGSDIYNKYSNYLKDKDLVIGSIANDRMFFVIDEFFSGRITDKALVKSLSALELGKQYVAISQKGCKAIKIETEITLSNIEKEFIKEEAEKNRANGITYADNICKNYRREGLFFDEIIENHKSGDI